MSRFHSYINSAILLIDSYKGERPFAIFQKQFFAANKKFGSRDRQLISALCYNYFRMGFAGQSLSTDQKLLVGTFLCETEPSELMEKLRPEWNSAMQLPLEQKLAFLGKDFSLPHIFPFTNELSDGIEPIEYCKSFLVQPMPFLRIRPQSRSAAIKKLSKSKLSYQLLSEDCVQLSVAEKVEPYFVVDKEVVVQDYNSQKVLDYLKNGRLPPDSINDKTKQNLSAWDCCAASGGKSILLKDILNRAIDLTVSDIRANIIFILHQRFKKAGIKEYKYFITDLSNAGFQMEKSDFDLVICDAPCSGSGTWSRTPEQLVFFKKDSIMEFNALQKKIIANVMPHLRSGGLFIYITCSVFKSENELIADYIRDQLACDLLHMQLMKGYDKKADTMFVAVFRKL